MDYVIAFEGFYHQGRRPVYGTQAPCFTPTKEKAHGFATRLEADRELEILSARHPNQEYRVEERP